MSRRVVVKVGSSTVTGGNGRVDREVLSRVVAQIAQIQESGDRVVLVTSGAIAAGLEALDLESRPTDMPTLQATAAVGQVRLVETYAELFAEAGITVGQVLLTRQDTGHRQQYLHACHTLSRLLDLGIVPIVNENDTTAVDEIKMGDNDHLAALVAVMIRAELVILLTDIDGLYSADPRSDADATLVTRVDDAYDERLLAAGGPGSTVGSGGMATKVEAARMLMKAGIPMVVCDGTRHDVIVAAAAGEPVGTLFAGGTAALKGRKLWIAYAGRPAGAVSIDDGAKDALCLRGGSLLPAGVTEVSGSFVVGDPISVMDPEGHVVARGLAAMSSKDLKRVKGLKTKRILEMLPEWDGEEVIHRDQLVVL